jgi:hypothetical protein
VIQLNALLNSYNLFRPDIFPIKIGEDSSAPIDNIFIDNSKFDSYKIFPLNNGPSDYDAQLITINIAFNQSQDQTYFKT